VQRNQGGSREVGRDDVHHSRGTNRGMTTYEALRQRKGRCRSLQPAKIKRSKRKESTVVKESMNKRIYYRDYLFLQFRMK